MLNGNDKRIYNRYLFRIPIQIETEGASCWSFTEDLSMGGLFFHSYNPPDSGQCLDLRLGCPGGPADMVLQGRVVHRRERTKARIPGEPMPGPPGAGVCFENTSQEARKWLASLLLSQNPDTLEAGAFLERIDLFGRQPWREDAEEFRAQGYQPMENPGSIARIFETLCSKISEIRVKRPGSGALYTTYFVRMENGSRTPVIYAEPLMLRDPERLSFGKTSLILFFSLEGSHYAFSCFVSPEALKTEWSFPLPARLHVKKEFRQARYALEMRYPLTVEFPDPADPDRHRVKNVVDLSYRGLAFKNYPGEEVYRTGVYLPDVTICAFDLYCRKTDAVVKHVSLMSPPDGQIYQRVGLEFPEEGFGRLEEIPRIKQGEMERITGAAHVTKHLQDLSRSRVRVLAESGRCILFANGLLSAKKQNGSTGLAVAVPPVEARTASGEVFTEGSVTCHYLFYGMYHFFKTKTRRENGGFLLDAPETIYKAKRRRALRIRPGTLPFRFGFLHPILGRKFVFPVRDLSTRGLCFEGDYQQSILWKGFSLRGCELCMGEERLPVGTVEIRSVSSPVNEDGQVEPRCGVEFMDLPLGTERRISLHILRENNPKIRTLTSEKIDNLWNLFYESGFIYPSKEAYIKKIKAEINETWKKLLSEETSFYKNLVFREGEQEMGTASAVQAYENTWMFQHLAATGHPTKLVPKYVMLGLAQFLMENQEIQYLIAYFRPDNSFPTKIFSGFLDAYPLEDHILFTRYSYLALDLDEADPVAPRAGLPTAASAGGGCVVEAALSEDREVVESYFQKALHPLLIRSRSLYRDTLQLPETSARFFGRGLLRERHCLVARGAGQRISAFALLENASPGINLSGLLNTFSIWSLPGVVAGSPVRRQLIRAAVDRYRSWGARTAICLTDEADIADYLAEGFRKTKEYVCFSLSRRTIKSYYDYVQERFGRFEQRRLRSQPEFEA